MISAAADPFGLTDPETIQNPYPVYARLREEDPVHWSDGWQGWLVTRYADVLAGFRDPRLSANRSSAYAGAMPPAVRQQMEPLIRNLGAWALLIDPPAHTRLRALINKAFTPRLISYLRPRIETLVGDLLDAAASPASPNAGFDVIRDLAYPLPVTVIGEMMGLPYSDNVRLKRWSDGIASFLGAAKMSMEIGARAVEGVREMDEYFRGVLAERRRNPGEDFLSSLIGAEEKGAILDEQELLSTCTLVLFGGHETTTHLIGNGILSLLHHPDQLALLRADPALLPAAIEELLRYDSPVTRMGRIAKEDFTLHGKAIQKGQRVWLVMSAANRDPAQFKEPDRLDVRRADNRHLSFGMGAHYCPGAALGRLEAEIAIGSLIRRHPGLRVAGPTPRWLDNITIRGFETLPVALNCLS